MEARKTLSGLTPFLFTAGAAAQASLPETGLTLEESLVQFVNSFIGFEVTSTYEVVLYIVAPLIGFYYLTLNFVSMGYELFQERVDRPGWRNTDDDIPTGMKGFSMIVSFITVLFLGTAGAGILLFAGLGSLLLAALMMAGLFQGFGDNEQQGQQQPQQPRQQQGQQQQQQQEGGGWADMLNAAGNLLETGQNAANNLQKRGQQQTQNQLQESLKYFQNDIISEIDRVRSGHTNIENLISQLNNELTDPNDFDPDTFKNTLQRAQKVDDLLTEMRDRIAADLSSSSSPNFPASNLANFLSSNTDRNPEKEISGLEGQLERILSSTPASPPNDAFNDLLDELQYVVAAAHFMHYSPFSMSEIASDASKADKVVVTAESMNKIQSRPDNVNRLQQMAGWLDSRSSIPANLIEAAEKLCRKELKVNETELEVIKGLVGEDEDIHNKLKYIDRNISNYSNLPSYVQKNIDNAESEVKNVDNMLASLESKVTSQQEYESQVYEKLEELKGKI